MARAPIASPAVQRSQYLADALMQMRQQPPQMSGYADLGTNLLAQALTEYGARRADRRVMEEQEAAERARQEQLAPLLGLFGGQPGAQAQGPQMAQQGGEMDAVAALLGPDPAQQQPQQGLMQQQGGVPTWEQAAPALAQAAAMGVDVGDYLDIVRYGQPNVQVDAASGQAYDPTDRSNIGRQFVRPEVINGMVVNLPEAVGQQFPDLEPGQEYVFDAQGNVAGVRNAAGVIQSVAERERATADARAASEASYAGAIAGARAQGSAPFEIATVQGPQGQTITGSRADLLGMGPIAGPTPDQVLGAELETRRQADERANLPAAQNRIQAAERSSQVVTRAIDQALNQIGPFSTGVVGAITAPVPGTPGRDLRSVIDTIKANVGFDYLQQMREASPTGGALGQVAVQELQMLQSVVGSLDPNQSPEQLERSLRQVRDLITNGMEWRRNSFQERYQSLQGQGQNQGQGGQVSRQQAIEELRRRGRIP